MADISGIVTDTNLVPLAGAAVQLEAGGQTASTDNDGRFTLVLNVGVSQTKNRQFTISNISARIRNNVLIMNAAERSAMSITVYNLDGKTIFTEQRTINAGNSSLILPGFGAGVYLYRLKSGNGELIIKGNSIDANGTNAVLSNVATSEVIVKQASGVSSFNDIINIQKAGYLNYREAVTDSGTDSLVIRMINCYDSAVDVDGNIYQAVRLGNQIWTAENLKATRYNDSTPIPNAIDSAEWVACSEGAYCFYENDTAYKKYYGALYNWYTVNTGKLAPKGWHVPDSTEWNTLRDYLIASGYNYDSSTTDNRIAQSMVTKVDWTPAGCAGCSGTDLTENNRSGFAALPGGFRSSVNRFSSYLFEGRWWTATDVDTATTTAIDRGLYYYKNYIYRRVNMNEKTYGLSIRLVKDD